jgi:hypothetical protein
VISTASDVQALANAGTSVSRPSYQRMHAITGSAWSGLVTGPRGTARAMRGMVGKGRSVLLLSHV